MGLMTNTLTETQRVQVVAGLAGADLRTTRKFLEGKPIRGRFLRERLEAAVRQLAAPNDAPEPATHG